MKRDLFHIQKAIRKFDAKEAFYYFAAVCIGFSAIQLSKAETPPIKARALYFDQMIYNKDGLSQHNRILFE